MCAWKSRWQECNPLHIPQNKLLNFFLNTTKHGTLHCIYNKHNFEVSLRRCLQSEFSHQLIDCHLLLMQTDHLYNDIYYLTMHVILKVCVKLENSILCHTIHIANCQHEINLPILYTLQHTTYTSLFISHRNFCHITDIVCTVSDTDNLLMTTYPECKQHMFISRAFVDSLIRKINFSLHSCTKTTHFITIKYIPHTSRI
jgi:hypothetical protein